MARWPVYAALKIQPEFFQSGMIVRIVLKARCALRCKTRQRSGTQMASGARRHLAGMLTRLKNNLCRRPT